MTHQHLQDSSDSRGDMTRLGDSGQEMSLKAATKNIQNITIPGLDRSKTRSLFVFGEDNSVRKYAKLIIEWGYPFVLGKPCIIMLSCTCIYIWLFYVCVCVLRALTRRAYV